MNERKAAPWVVGCLIVLGCLSIGLRLHAQKEASRTEISGLWRLGYTISLDAKSAGARVQLAIPRDTLAAKVVRQNVSYSELRQERVKTSTTQTRLSLIATKAGHYEISARYDLDVRHRTPVATDIEPAPTTKELERWLRATPVIQARSPIVRDKLSSLLNPSDSTVDKLQKIYEYCHLSLHDTEGDETASDAEEVIQKETGSAIGRIHAMLALCRAAAIPARLVTGFEISERPFPQPEYWLEVFVQNVWEPCDPVRGYFKKMPIEFIPICRGSEHIVVISDEGHVDIEYSIHRVAKSGFASSNNQHPADIFDLNRLPLTMHDALSVILLLPLGALVTAIFQTIVGVRTIGTFSPTLIALSFVLADWRTGVAVFSLVILVGLLSRALLDRLKLLMVPRLGFMLTLVVAFLVFTISILDYLRFTPSHQAVLLPMVILTMTVERFYVATAEDGVRAALKLMLGTILVSFCCYLTLRWHHVGALVFRFPEIHLMTLAAFVFLGRYTGYRITELWRFRDLVAEQEQVNRS